MGNGSGATPTYPFTCNVDGNANVFKNIAACVSFTGGGSSQRPAIVTSNTPEYIMAANGLPWDPATFTGTLQLGKGGANNPGTCDGSHVNCWLTDVPIIIGSGMSIVGSGNVLSGSPDFSKGTAIMPSTSFPAPLGSPALSASCAGTGGSLGAGNYLVEVVEVNNLNTFPLSNLPVPALSAFSNEVTASCPTGTTTGLITVTSPTTLGSGKFVGMDYRVFVSPLAGASGSETLQIPNNGNMTCTTGVVDPTYGCKLGTNATVNIITSGGDSPNLVDLSNPLVVEIGPLAASVSQYEGFWARLQNLTLALPATAGANDPNVAFWDLSDQENSGLSFVSFTGQTAAITPAETGAWIYIGPHAPNSFVANVQTDQNPSSGTFYGMILDGQKGFGPSGTARVVYNSTFTPGRGGGNPTIMAGALVSGNQANVDFLDDHFEVNGNVDCIQVVNGASVSAEGPQQLCNPFIHLRSSATDPLTPKVAGNDIEVRNVTTTTNKPVVQDDVNNVTLNTHVSDYSTAKDTATLTVHGSLNLPNQNANSIFAGPASGAAAAPAFRALVPADLPTGGTVQVLGAGQAGVVSSTNSIYLPWLGGAFDTVAAHLSAIAPSTGTIADLFVGVSAPYGASLTVRFTVASCRPSMGNPCVPVDSNLACQITGTLVTQCSQTLAADALPVTQGDEVFLHLMVPVGSTIPTRTVFMSYRLTGVQ